MSGRIRYSDKYYRARHCAISFGVFAIVLTCLVGAVGLVIGLFNCVCAGPGYDGSTVDNCSPTVYPRFFTFFFIALAVDIFLVTSSIYNIIRAKKYKIPMEEE